MRIDQTSGSGAPMGAARARRRQTGFSVRPDDEPEAAPAPDTMACAATAGLVALAQAGGEAPGHVSDEAAAGHGGAVLDAMAGLQRALLEGGGAAARDHLAALMEGLPKAADPALDSVLQAIGQRAAVELARSE